jgi:hypothetical protein
MSNPVYDLGDVDLRARQAQAQRPDAGRSGKRSAAAASPATTRLAMAAQHPAAWSRGEASSDPAGEGFAVGSTLSLFAPGMGQVIRGRVDMGVLFLASFGFLSTFAWAVWTSQARIAETLPFLGLSRAWNIRALLIAYGLAALLHVAAVVGSIPRRPGRKPAAGLLALASATVPGWGQALSGRRWRTGLCLGGLWAVGFVWLLASPAMQAALARHDLILPAGLEMLIGPLALYTGPAVLWAVAMSDAFHGRDRED